MKCWPQIGGAKVRIASLALTFNSEIEDCKRKGKGCYEKHPPMSSLFLWDWLDGGNVSETDWLHSELNCRWCLWSLRCGWLCAEKWPAETLDPTVLHLTSWDGSKRKAAWNEGWLARTCSQCEPCSCVNGYLQSSSPSWLGCNCSAPDKQASLRSQKR